MKPHSVWVEFDPARLCLTRYSAGDRPCSFAVRGRQFRLVHFMARRNSACGGIPVVCRHEELIEAVWGSDTLADPHSELSRLVHDLRRKIEKCPDSPQLIVSSPGIGYELRTRPWRSDDCSAPFTWGVPVLHPKNFFGRRTELRRIREASSVRPPQHLFVFGPRHAGKTSLLRFLEFLPHASPEDLNPGLQPGHANRKIVFIDMHDPRVWQIDQFLSSILARAGLGPVTGLDRFIGTLAEAPPMTILLDDIEEAVPLDTSVWDALRFLGTSRSGSVNLVAASTWSIRELWDRCATLRPLLRIAGHEILLGPLAEDEARELIASSPVPFPEDDANWIFETSHREPCLLQILCDTCLRHLRGDEDGEWKERAIARSNALWFSRESNRFPMPAPIATVPSQTEN